MDAADKAHGQTAYDREDVSGGMGLLTPEGPAVDAEEEAFIRAMTVSYTHLDVYKRQAVYRLVLRARHGVKFRQLHLESHRDVGVL